MGTYLNTARRVFERLKVGSVSSGSGNQSVSPPSTHVATFQDDDVPLSANTTKTTLTTKPPSFTATSGTTKTTNPHTSTTETTKPPDSTTETTKPRSSTTKTAKPQVAPSWSALQFARQRAESAHDLRAIWKATLEGVALWWRAAGAFDELQLGGYLDQRLMEEIGSAIRDDDRVVALVRIEEWRDAWLRVLGQDDLVSTGRLSVIDSFRRFERKLRARQKARGM